MQFGGLDTRSGAVNSPKSVQAEACDFSAGTLRGAKSHQKQNTSAVIGSLIQGATPYYTAALGNHTLVVAAGKLYTLTGAVPNQAYTEVSTGTPFHTTNNADMIPFKDRVFITDGSNVPKVWDGTALRNAGPPAKPAAAPGVAAIDQTPSTFQATTAPFAIGAGTLGRMAAPTVTPLGTGGVVMSGAYMWWCVSAIVGGVEQIQSPANSTSVNGGTVYGDGMNISWAAVAGATAYRVYLYRWNEGTYSSGGVYANQYYCEGNSLCLSVNFKFSAVVETVPHSLTGVTWTAISGTVTASGAKLIPSDRLMYEQRDALSVTMQAAADSTLNLIEMALWASPTPSITSTSGGTASSGIETPASYTASSFAATLTVREYSGAFSTTPEMGAVIYTAGITVPSAPAFDTIATGAAPKLTHNPTSTISMLNGKYYSITITPVSTSNKLAFLTSAAATALNWVKSSTWAALTSGPGSLTLSGGLGSLVLNGSFTYAYTYYNSTTALESDISAGAAIALVKQGARVSFVPSTEAGVDKIRLYRMVAGTYRRVSEITNAAVTSSVIAGTGWLNGIATIKATAHGAVVNQYVTITGVTPSPYNGTWLINGVPDVNTLSIAMPNPGVWISGGTVTLNAPISDFAFDATLTEPCASIGYAPPPMGMRGMKDNPYVGCLMGWLKGTFWMSLQTGLAYGREVFPTYYYKEVGTDDNPIQNVVVLHGYALVFLKNGVKVATGSSPVDMHFETILDAPGLYAPRAVAVTGEGVVYLSSFGLIQITSGGWQPMLQVELAAEFDASNSAFGLSTTAVMGYVGRQLFLSYPSLKTMVLDTRNDQSVSYMSPLKFEVYYDLSMSKAAGAVNVTAMWRDAEKLFFATSTGDVYQVNGSVTKQLLTWESIPQDLGKADTMKWFHQFIVDCVGPLTVTLYLDGVAASSVSGAAISGTSRDRVEFKVDGYARRLQAKFIATAATAEVFGFMATQSDTLGGHN